MATRRIRNACQTYVVSITRVVTALAVAIGLGWTVVRATATSESAPSTASCSAAALSAPVSHLASTGGVNAYGCEGSWAYLWATITVGPNRIGVTELMRFDPSTNAWHFASRARYCHPGVLPAVVYRRACFSN